MTDATQAPSKEQVDDIVTRLNLACVSSCSCLVKTPVVHYHKPKCLYRVLQEAAAEVTGLRSALEDSQLAEKRWKETCQRMSAGHEPPADAEKLLDELIDAASKQDVSGEHFMGYAYKCQEIDRRAKRTREARSAVLAALRPSSPPGADELRRRLEFSERQVAQFSATIAGFAEQHGQLLKLAAELSEATADDPLAPSKRSPFEITADMVAVLRCSTETKGGEQA